jgi:large subunit ribosomal protein L15
VGLVRRKNRPVKLLGNGEISRALTIHVDAASEGAVKAVEAAGGKVILPAAKTESAEKAE